MFDVWKKMRYIKIKTKWNSFQTRTSIDLAAKYSNEIWFSTKRNHTINVWEKYHGILVKPTAFEMGVSIIYCVYSSMYLVLCLKFSV